MSDRPSRASGQHDQAPDDGDPDGSRWAEPLLVAVSVVFTVVLFSFVIWQASTTPTVTEPQASVTDTDPLPGGEVKVTVAFRNAQDIGIVIATVEVDCDTPPPELTFENIPADDRRSGYVLCPPGTTNPTASVSTWIEA